LKPNRPLKAKLGGGWEAKRARSCHVSGVTIHQEPYGPMMNHDEQWRMMALSKCLAELRSGWRVRATKNAPIIVKL
jgi:hypothetical protein